MKDRFYAVIGSEIKVYERQDLGDVLLASFEAVKAKGSVRHCFEVFRQNGEWYGLNVHDSHISVHSLPSMEVIASNHAGGHPAVAAVWLPRLVDVSDEHQGEKYTFVWHANEASEDWYSSNFCAIRIFDPYSGGDVDYLCFYDLSRIKEGLITSLGNAVGIPEWLELKDAVHFDPNKEGGYLGITTYSDYYLSPKGLEKL